MLRRFAELTSAAGTLHTYKISELSLWAAASSGFSPDDLISALHSYSAMRVPADLERQVVSFAERYGQLRIIGQPGALKLVSDDKLLLRHASSVLGANVENEEIAIDDVHRGVTKARLAEAGYPVVDEASHLQMHSGGYVLTNLVALRDYQRDAVIRFIDHSHDGGVILLPCGSGKTVVGVAIAAMLDACVLVVTPNRTIGEQWANHFVQMTSLQRSDISLFSSGIENKPVSILTYQALTNSSGEKTSRLEEAVDIPWGLVIFDEVHSLPADVFRQSAALQSRRRLGLTATLVREDGRERDVFALVGPPVWQARWRDLEAKGWISPVECFEVRVRTDRPLSNEDQALAAKIRVVQRLADRHHGDRVLIAAHRIREVQALSRRIGAPAITGETSGRERSRLYEAFRIGDIRTLIVSKVANFGVDLPDANVLIQVSGTFGSRMEEAQRLGRVLRPKAGSRPARFYSLIIPDTREREFAERRQRFLVDQGYRYSVINARA
jgi:DNA excision repair protein ERCC-3